MWLEAIITHQDLVQVVAAFLPVRINLHTDGDDTESDRWLLLQPATVVTLVADRGLRVTCPAELRWPIAGLGPTITIDKLCVLVRPQVVEEDGGHLLTFTLELEDVDFHRLPDFIDATIVKAANAALSTRNLSWNFTETFTRTVGLGKRFDPVEALEIGVRWGKQRIGAEALTLVVSFEIGFARGMVRATAS